MWNKHGVIFNKHWSQLPIVDDSYQDKYRIYYSRRINNKSYPLYIDVSNDGFFKVLHECSSPIVDLGKLGMFDQAGVMPAEIISYNGIKYLYYIGWSNRVDVPYHNQIGLALSYDNGKTFEKAFSGPVLGTSRSEPGFTGTISILIEDNVWRAWYLSCRKWERIGKKVEPIYDIKYAVSNNGIDWSITNTTCIKLLENEGGISQASIIKENGLYHMWFSARGKTNYRESKEHSYKIYYATSADGIAWNRCNEPALQPSSEGWDADMVEYPYVVSNDREKIMFYNGNGFGKSGIGIAKMPK